MPHDDCLFIRLGDFFAARRSESDDPEQPLAPPGDAPRAAGARALDATVPASRRPDAAAAVGRVRPTS